MFIITNLQVHQKTKAKDNQESHRGGVEVYKGKESCSTTCHVEPVQPISSCIFFFIPIISTWSSFDIAYRMPSGEKQLLDKACSRQNKESLGEKDKVNSTLPACPWTTPGWSKLGCGPWTETLGGICHWNAVPGLCDIILKKWDRKSISVLCIKQILLEEQKNI